MKRATIWLSMTLLTFTLGVTVALIYLKINGSYKQKTEDTTSLVFVNNAKENSELLTLSFCELSSNPEMYDGKVVRLNANLVFGLEGAWFSDPECKTLKASTLVFIKEDAWKTIEKARKQKKDKLWAMDVNLTVIGKFKNQDPKNCCIVVSSQFEIQQVEKVYRK
jgi:hypothetical protein